MDLLVGLLFIAFGLVMLIFPTFFFELTESWKSSSSEPSDLYITSTRIGGVIVTLVGIAGVVNNFIH